MHKASAFSWGSFLIAGDGKKNKEQTNEIATLTPLRQKREVEVSLTSVRP